MSDKIKVVVNGVEHFPGTFVDEGYVDYRSGVIDMRGFRPVGEPISVHYDRRHPVEKFVDALDSADQGAESGSPRRTADHEPKAEMLPGLRDLVDKAIR